MGLIVPPPNRARCGRQANPTNTIGAGQNWGVYDWCNQFLQQSEELEEAACAVIAERAAVNVVHCEVWPPQRHRPQQDHQSVICSP